MTEKTELNEALTNETKMISELYLALWKLKMCFSLGKNCYSWSPKTLNDFTDDELFEIEKLGLFTHKAFEKLYDFCQKIPRDRKSFLL